jgi:hypothetical protein
VHRHSAANDCCRLDVVPHLIYGQDTSAKHFSWVTHERGEYETGTVAQHESIRDHQGLEVLCLSRRRRNSNSGNAFMVTIEKCCDMKNEERCDMKNGRKVLQLSTKAPPALVHVKSNTGLHRFWHGAATNRDSILKQRELC